MAFADGDVVNQFARHGDFKFRLLAQRHAHGVADAFGEQCADAHSRLYAAVLAVASLGHTEMQRIVHVLAVHFRHEAAHGLNHDHRVGSLDGYCHVVEILLAEYPQILHCRLNHSGWGVAVAAHDAVR